MSNDKQTAVEWLVKELNQKIDFIPLEKWDMIRDIIQQAKEMEKEQIEEAYKYARAHWSREDGNAERYYNETYGGNK
jgi:succinate dehydrogenase/fumarate reductase-like Fe-S protein